MTLKERFKWITYLSLTINLVLLLTLVLFVQAIR